MLKERWDVEYLWEYTQKLVAFVILCNILKNIMPENNDTKIIRFMIGAIMTLIMIQPLLNLKGVDINDIVNESYNRINNVSLIRSDMYMKLYESEVNNILVSNGLSGDVSVNCNDKEINRIYIMIKQNNNNLSDEEIDTYVKEQVASVFHIDRRIINVRNI